MKNLGLILSLIISHYTYSIDNRSFISINTKNHNHQLYMRSKIMCSYGIHKFLSGIVKDNFKLKDNKISTLADDHSIVTLIENKIVAIPINATVDLPLKFYSFEIPAKNGHYDFIFNKDKYDITKTTDKTCVGFKGQPTDCTSILSPSRKFEFEKKVISEESVLPIITSIFKNINKDIDREKDLKSYILNKENKNLELCIKDIIRELNEDEAYPIFRFFRQITTNKNLEDEIFKDFSF